VRVHISEKIDFRHIFLKAKIIRIESLKVLSEILGCSQFFLDEDFVPFFSGCLEKITLSQYSMSKD